MLTFFRRIRKGLLDGGKTRRYLLYAIGEIALVVIGILIALQINNWNEQRKYRALEDTTLTEIRISLQHATDELSKMIESNSLKFESCMILLQHYDQGYPFHDSLLIHILRFDSQFFPLAAGMHQFENVVEKGMKWQFCLRPKCSFCEVR